MSEVRTEDAAKAPHDAARWQVKTEIKKFEGDWTPEQIAAGVVVDLTPPPVPRPRIRLPLRRAEAKQVETFHVLFDGDGGIGREEQMTAVTAGSADTARAVDVGDTQDTSEGMAEEMQVLALLGLL